MKKTLSFILFLIISNFTSAQCAMCKAVVESGDIQEAEGLNSGILYLMIIPYLLVGALLYFLVKYKRKNKI
jgi:heme/copper-type cytochrome/quinol oxidase subunit 2